MHKIEKRPHTHFRTKKAISRNPKVKIYRNLKKWIPWHGNYLTTHSLPENKSPKLLKMSNTPILTPTGGHFGFVRFSEGAPWFSNFFQFFLRKWDQEVSSDQFIRSSWWSETMTLYSPPLLSYRNYSVSSKIIQQFNDQIRKAIFHTLKFWYRENVSKAKRDKLNSKWCNSVIKSSFDLR